MVSVHNRTSDRQRRRHIAEIWARMCVRTSSCLSTDGLVFFHSWQEKHMFPFYTTFYSIAFDSLKLGVWEWEKEGRQSQAGLRLFGPGLWSLTALHHSSECYFKGHEGGSEVGSYRWNHTRYAQPQRISKTLTRHQNRLLRKILSGCVVHLIYSVRLRLCVCVCATKSFIYRVLGSFLVVDEPCLIM